MCMQCMEVARMLRRECLRWECVWFKWVMLRWECVWFKWVMLRWECVWFKWVIEVGMSVVQVGYVEVGMRVVQVGSIVEYMCVCAAVECAIGGPSLTAFPDASFFVLRV
jgi:hypothetical protein